MKDKSNIIFSMIWKFTEQCSVQLIQFIVQLILAKLLLPKDYGVMAMIMVFVGIANTCILSGFNVALIQKKNVDEKDYSTVFFANIVMAVFLYGILFACSGFISKFYKMEGLESFLKVISMMLFFTAVHSIQMAIMTKEMQFKKIFFCSVEAVTGSGIIGIFMAYRGYGVWALVGQQLSYNILLCITMRIYIKWHPKPYFSFKRLKKLFRFGGNYLAASLINSFYSNLYSLVIGKIYNSTQLGIYNRAEQFPKFLNSSLDSTIKSVMLPVYSANQDNWKEVKQLVRKAIITSSYLIFPMMAGLSAIAKPLVLILLSEKWISAVPIMQILCWSYMLYPLHSINLQAINAMGFSQSFLKAEVIKKIVSIVILCFTLLGGLKVLTIGVLLSSFLSLFINMQPNIKILHYGYREQIKDISGNFIISIIMFIVVLMIGNLNMIIAAQILLQILTGIVVYVSLSIFFKLEGLQYYTLIVKKFLRRR